MRIALDAMGGDHAPASAVEGALAAADDGFHILLVGDEAVLREEIGERGGLPANVHVHHASQVVEMEEAPRQALRSKKDSSLRVAFELLRNDQADAVVTMGNSGAALAMGMFVCGRLPGVLRPAIAALVPGKTGPTVLLDAGANVDCKPEHLLQFARMGSALATAAHGVESPRVAVLSNGAEEGKGTDLTRASAALLEASTRLHSVGYVEPSDVFTSRADVVVTDGWTGNVLLKTAEAVAKHLTDILRDAARSTVFAKAGGLLLGPALRKALAPLDHRQVGGAMLLGIEGTAVIGHGSADGRAVASALRLTERLVREGLLLRIREALSSADDSGNAVGS
jgi:phosphate acyltransferase